MAKNSRKVRVETVWYKGKKYTRYPDSKKPNHRRYFQRHGSSRLPPVSLHRVVWEGHNGPVPKGYAIHHKDGDTGNNFIENLECLPQSDHQKLHWAEGSYETPACKAHQAKFGQHTAAWRETERFREMLVQNGKVAWERREYKQYQCEQCQGTFESLNPLGATCCSRRCAQRLRAAKKRELGISFSCKCEWCSIDFGGSKKTTRFCSPQCSGYYREAKKRGQ